MSHQKLNVITVMLVLILFGTVCTCYAIDCMDLWDDEAIAEMIEDEKRYEERRKARESGENVDENVYDDDVDDDDDDDEEDHESDGEDALADHEHENVGDDGEEEQHHEEAHGTSKSHTETRHKRQLTEQQWQASVPAEQDASTDLEVAETHLFRPVFRYKSQYTERRRVRDNLTPSRQ
uniref:Secreted protein n=1 Tax=Anopheles atroparvus TaxID=41427 RepID=A0A182IM93_ANOAO